MSVTVAVTESPVTQGDVVFEVPVFVNEVSDETKVGEYVGQCKWFNDKLGYGFLTIQVGVEKGRDIFVHHSGVMPLNSNYKTLKKGEYVNFNIIDGENGLQAVDVTGIGGGSLMCDVSPTVKFNVPVLNGMSTPVPVPTGIGARAPMHSQNVPPSGEFVKVQYRKKPSTSGPPSSYKPTGGRGAGRATGMRRPLNPTK